MRKVLIIDGNPNNLRCLEIGLSANGHIVEAFLNCSGAMTTLKNWTFDAILATIENNGEAFQLAKHARQKNSRIKIIFMSPFQYELEHLQLPAELKDAKIVNSFFFSRLLEHIES